MSNIQAPKRSEVIDFTREPEALPEGAEAPVRPEWALTEARLPLFSYTDDEGVVQTVTMPDKPNPGLALNFLRKGRTIGAELAIPWLIEEAIGAEAMDRLIDELSHLDDPSTGLGMIRDIGQKVQSVVMGGLEGPKA